MCAFYTGGPTSVPTDEYECGFGRWGWLGRALKDAPRLVLTRFPASVIVVIAVAAMTSAAVAANSDEPVLTQAVSAALSVILGVGIGLIFVAGWTLTPWGRDSHWRTHIGRFAANGGAHSGFWVVSGHWHWVENLRCTISDSAGNTYSSPPWTPNGRSRVLLAPGGNGGGFEFPSGFRAPNPSPGTYRVLWLMDVKGRKKPLVIAQTKWTLTD